MVQNNPYGSLANCWFQPLTHPSGLKAFETPSLTDGNAKIRTFFQFARYRAKKCSRGSHPDCIFWLNRNNDNLITNFSLVNCKVKRIANFFSNNLRILTNNLRKTAFRCVSFISFERGTVKNWPQTFPVLWFGQP